VLSTVQGSLAQTDINVQVTLLRLMFVNVNMTLLRLIGCNARRKAEATKEDAGEIVVLQ